jgi:hypothetical protein
MKPQDIGFIIALFVIAVVRRPVVFIWAGLLCLAVAIPLFATWTFFTAERLTWYAGAFFFIYILYSLVLERKNQYNNKKGEKHL